MPRKKAPPAPDVYERIRRNVRTLMGYHDMDGNQLAERMGFAKPQSLYDRLNGLTRWTPADLEKLSEIFGVEPGFFFGNTPFGGNSIISGYTGKTGVDSAEPGPSRRTAA